MTAIDYNFAKYLAAKKEIDDRALNRTVSDELASRLPKNRPKSPLLILELGAGIGTMVERLVSWGLITSADYTAVDSNVENIRKAQKRLDLWGQQNQFVINWQAPTTAVVSTDLGRLSVSFDNSDAYNYLEQSIDKKQWDLGLAHAFMDLVNAAEIVPLFCRLIKPGGLLYFSLNYDGETVLLPTIDRDLDERILQLYNQSMDERIINGKKSGNSKTGRGLFTQLLNAGAQILAAGSSDWVVFSNSDGYSENQTYFLHYIVHTIYKQLKDHPSLNREQFQTWAHKRYEQIEKGQLIFIAKQIDVLAEIPK